MNGRKSLMSRVITATSLAGAAALALAGVFAIDLFAGKGDEKKPAVTKKAEKDREVALASRSASAAQLPVAQVVLFNSGVGYFQREGTVEGNTRIDLSFPVQDINDMLKSMVVRDLDGGVVSTVS